ncbi:MAG: glucosaminidase domain-containing protein [Bacteroidales bacterium]
MKFFVAGILTFIIVTGTLNKGSAQLTNEKYIEKYNELAVALMNEYSIPASIILSVALIESAACNSRNCKLLNNHFGIKTTRKYRIPGTKHITAYKMYESDTASYRHFCEWIMKRKFYQDLCGYMDYKPWTQAISRSGYTMSPANWKKKVNSTIVKYKLMDYDAKMNPWFIPQ